MTVTTEKTNGHSPARVGRPRANPRPLNRPPEEEILAAAGRLFAEKGFTATSTREIAEAAGLRQPSLFHYYAKKEKILEALLERIADWTLQYARQLQQLDGSAAAKLYQLLFFDVLHMSSGSYPGHALLYLPEVRPPNFPGFWEKERQLTALLEELVAQGIVQGDLAPANPKLAAAAVRGMGTGTATWAWRSEQAPEALAHHVANLQLRALVRDASALERIREGAALLCM